MDKGSITIRGRLSFPNLTAKSAFELSQKGSFPSKDEASTSPHFLVLLNQTQYDKAKAYIVDVFLPFCQEQYETVGEKAKNALSPAEVKKLVAVVEGPLDDQDLNTPFKPVSEQSQILVPDAVAAIKVMGPRGGDFDQFAIVRSDADISDPDVLFVKPAVLPIEQTNFELYAGCDVRCTISAYSYRNGKHPGVSASANDIVFAADNTRFGGGASFDEDAILMDDDD